MTKISPNTPCPCHSGQKYKKCCRPLHQGQKVDDPVRLMRSRYSAYVLRDFDYIERTMHPESKHLTDDMTAWQTGIRLFAESTDFIGLEILGSELSLDDLNMGWVTFHAILETEGEDASYVERSLFKKVDGQWLYLHADALDAG
jgi:SEC-C motif-containing protein